MIRFLLKSNDISRLSKPNFLEKYGHLRPNSYEITSLNYKDGYQKYFKNRKKNFSKKTFIFEKIKNQKFEKVLLENLILNLHF